MDKLTPEQRKKNMQHVKSKDSQIELMLRRALWQNGLRYRKNVRSVFGCPDIVFLKLKIAVFCDSEFWHGYDWENRKHDFKSHQDFWIPKIERNMARDREVNEKLIADGWIVLRFFGKEIKKNLDNCVQKVVSAVKKRKMESVKCQSMK
jgi:DNA mismatch endonuclease (patch repair protein)